MIFPVLSLALVSAAPMPAWDFAALGKAMAASGRKTGISERTFAKLQARKAVALDDIKTYLEGRLGHADEAVLQAFRDLPREYFHYHYENKAAFCEEAYEDPAKPWALGYGSALSDYLGQAYMAQLCDPSSEDRVLEIGTGSGFNAALFSRMAKEVYSIEIVKPLGEAVSNLFAPLGLNNVHTRVGDGFYGWPEVEGGFDIIIVTCAARSIPPPLLNQLRPHGRMVIPLGQPFRGKQMLYIYTKGADGRVHSRRDSGVFFVPMRGAAEKQAEP